MNHRTWSALAVAWMSLASLPVAAQDAPETITVRHLSMELAGEVARAAVQDCRARGYQVSAVVVDRNGIIQVVMRDVLASRFTLQIAEEKANAVVLSGVSSSEFRRNRADIREEMNHVDGILMLEGGVPIQAAGRLLGAVGVSGAPGGELDHLCAEAGVAEVLERLEFAE